MSTQYFIIPGYGNSNEGHWQSYFEKKIPNCSRIHQQSWEYPMMKDWVMAIQDKVSKHPKEEVFLITHSLGGIALAHWAAEFSTKIKGALIVAPPDIENPWKELPIASFSPIPTRHIPFPTLIVGSTDDPWSTTSRTEEMAQNWGSQLTFIGNAGHINTSSGYGNWDLGLDLLKDFVAKL